MRFALLLVVWLIAMGAALFFLFRYIKRAWSEPKSRPAITPESRQAAESEADREIQAIRQRIETEDLGRNSRRETTPQATISPNGEAERQAARQARLEMEAAIASARAEAERARVEANLVRERVNRSMRDAINSSLGSSHGARLHRGSVVSDRGNIDLYITSTVTTTTSEPRAPATRRSAAAPESVRPPPPPPPPPPEAPTVWDHILEED